jgi:hypothetical protein
MIYYEKSGVWLSILLLFCLFYLWACHAPVKGTKATSTPSKLENILVIPFKDMAHVYGEDVTVRCPLCGRFFTTGKVVAGADRFLTDQLITILKRHKNIRLIPSNQAQGVFAWLLSTREKEMPELEMIVEIGRTLGADAVLVGYVYRFKERQGSTYSVDTPASVAFDIDLVSVNKERIIWYGRYNETQKALTDDLFQFGKFIKRKGRWVTAWEMAVNGLEDVFQTFPMP